jgi:hypothetical protein
MRTIAAGLSEIQLSSRRRLTWVEDFRRTEPLSRWREFKHGAGSRSIGGVIVTCSDLWMIEISDRPGDGDFESVEDFPT